MDRSIRWELPGHGEPCDLPDDLRYRAHVVREGGRALYHIQAYRPACLRASCPRHYMRGWAAREATRAYVRLRAYQRTLSRTRELIHVVVSPLATTPRTVEEYRALRKRCYRAAEEAGLSGGVWLFHPVRIPSRWNERELCQEGPHWHVIGCGWITGGTTENVIVRNLGIRDSPRATLLYVLSHLGLAFGPTLGQRSIDRSSVSENRLTMGKIPRPRPVQSITWTGGASYSRLNLGEEDEALGEYGVHCRRCDTVVPLEEWLRVSPEFGQKPPPSLEIGEIVVTDGRGWMVDPSIYAWNRDAPTVVELRAWEFP